MNALTVYRASAGSGKTFTLAVKYIDLLVQNPMAYKTTLAVTFTNKATEEMKMRILSQLYGLWKGLPDSDDYLKKVMEDTGQGEEQVRKNSGRALKFIIHDYNYFCVETIDSFFQRVLRNLARELDLTANLRVELGDKEVEQMAVDRLIAGLTDTSEVLGWIISYIEESISDDKNWNVINSIKKFGESIFSDEYKAHCDELTKTFGNDRDFFTSYQQSLRKIVDDTTDAMKKYAERFEKILADNGLEPADFSRGTGGPCGYFLKLKNGIYDDSIFNSYAQKAAESADNWVTKKYQKPGNKNYDVAGDYLMPLLKDAEAFRAQHVKLSLSAKVTLRHLHQLRLLNHIKTEVTNINGETNRFLLSDTQTLLHELMKESDAPFIFEKIGGQLQHIMIDEFQDTSTVQWNNFKKLLGECMSHEESQNLIVGDVKQSIYRWRSGDWHLLHNIESEKLFLQGNCETTTLDTNFRSERNIINFNNEFFLRAAKIESEQLKENNLPEADTIANIYKEEHLCQKVPDKNGSNGLIRIDLLPKDDYEENTRRIIREHIQMLIDKGASQNDIAIIVRDNKNIRMLAETLQREMPEYSFISDEAFQLNASRAVNIMITAMHVLCNPNDNLSIAQLQKLSGCPTNELLDTRDRLLTLPLRDLSERLYAMFNIDSIDNEAAYICAFNDQVSQYVQHNVPILSEFLTAWNETIYKKSVKGGYTEGIRLLTIHKSKGLEFDHLIIPFCDWKMDSSATLWCETHEQPFSLLPVIPLDYASAKGTIYQAYYDDERLQSLIDSMNMLYVAFTRASKNLFVITKNAHASTNSRAATIVETLKQLNKEVQDGDEKLMELLPDMNVEGDLTDKDCECSFTCGSIYFKKKNKKESDNVFLQRSDSIDVELHPSEMCVEFRQSNQSKRFIETEDTDEAIDTKQQKYIQIGTIMHQLLSQITTIDDLESAIMEFEKEGVVYDEDMNREKLIELIRKRVNQEKVRQWFSKDVEVYNECTILNTNPMTGEVYELRPDRVVKDGEKWTVIDFKFGRQKEEHTTQVLDYMQLLRDMGRQQVEGYLWYVYTNKIVEVEG